MGGSTVLVLYTYTICTCTLSGKKRKQQSGTSGPQGKKQKITPAGINSCLSVSEMGVVMLTCFKLLQLAHSKLHAIREACLCERLPSH